MQPSQQLVHKFEQLSKNDPRLCDYGKKLYWGLMNQILAFRALSTGLVQKGSMKDPNSQNSLIKQIG